MADPVTLSLAAMAASSVIGGLGAMKEGRDAQTAANYEAGQMEVNAGQARAVSQRKAIEDRRAGRLAESTLQARAAAGGGGAADPTVVNLAQGIGAESEYNALTSLYNGEEQARGMEGAAAAKRSEGAAAKRAGNIKGITSIIGGLGAMGSKYGGNGPASYNTTTGSAGASSSYFPSSGTTVTWR